MDTIDAWIRLIMEVFIATPTLAIAFYAAVTVCATNNRHSSEATSTSLVPLYENSYATDHNNPWDTLFDDIANGTITTLPYWISGGALAVRFLLFPFLMYLFLWLFLIVPLYGRKAISFVWNSLKAWPLLLVFFMSLIRWGMMTFFLWSAIPVVVVTVVVTPLMWAVLQMTGLYHVCTNMINHVHWVAMLISSYLALRCLQVYEKQVVTSSSPSISLHGLPSILSSESFGRLLILTFVQSIVEGLALFYILYVACAVKRQQVLETGSMMENHNTHHHRRQQQDNRTTVTHNHQRPTGTCGSILGRSTRSGIASSLLPSGNPTTNNNNYYNNKNRTKDNPAVGSVLSHHKRNLAIREKAAEAAMLRARRSHLQQVPSS